jgi:D-inositol-3-phosphate glycosyltransferase
MLSVHTCPLAVLGGKEAGGMNVYVRELSRELSRRGMYIDVFTRSQNTITPLTHTLGQNARIIHLPAGPLKPYDKNEVYKHLPEFVQHVREWQQAEETNYDIIHAHYWLSGAAGLLLQKYWDVPLVQMFHTLALLKNQIAKTEAEREPLFRAEREAEIMQKVDRIVAATPAEKSQLGWLYGAPLEKIDVVPCGVDTHLFWPRDKAEARQKLGLTAKRVVLLVGRIEPIKGVDVLIRAAAELVAEYGNNPAELAVLVVGGGAKDGQMQNPEAVRLQNLVGELGLEEFVHFLPSQNQNQMPYYYSAADVTVMSSHYESFGMAALESQACGTPVIASRVGGLPYAVHDKVSGLLVPDDDKQALAEALKTLLGKPQLRQQMGQQAIIKAEQYTWRSIANQVSQVYQGVRQPATIEMPITATLV